MRNWAPRSWRRAGVLSRYRGVFLIIVSLLVVAGLSLVLSVSDIDVLNPKGTIAAQQRDLIVLATLLMLLVVVPVFVLTFFVSWRYRASNTKATYRPDWDGNRKLEFAWWAVPAAIIVVLAVITWRTSHSLDPFRSIEASNKELRVQVVALQWKWLFIYPEQDIAAVNYLQLPEDTPVSFAITSDAPMNSFWIPQLGGQVYAMPGMVTKLHLMADGAGEYQGVSANLSGEGFADMRFKVRSSTQADFDSWVRTVKSEPLRLTQAEYDILAQKGSHPAPSYFSSADKDLHEKVVMKYMTPGQQPARRSESSDPTEEHHR